MTAPPHFEAFYKSILELVELLMELDPEMDTPEGKLLDGLARAVEEYEKKEFPI